MATSSSGKTLDPVQGLIDYVLEIKPYHTKIMEVLVEYVHSDNVDVTIIEDFQLQIDMEFVDTLGSEITEAFFAELTGPFFSTKSLYAALNRARFASS